jgi:hypothetical protein
MFSKRKDVNLGTLYRHFYSFWAQANILFIYFYLLDIFLYLYNICLCFYILSHLLLYDFLDYLIHRHFSSIFLIVCIFVGLDSYVDLYLLYLSFYNSYRTLQTAVLAVHFYLSISFLLILTWWELVTYSHIYPSLYYIFINNFAHIYLNEVIFPYFLKNNDQRFFPGIYPF